ncbi:MAG: alpha/beta hydrolase family protein [Gammaproteobacteria bacterium]|jgi:pimeloyl-ACP methyl ester carboxylesterase|nr:alpha/beta hydrolase family protein [Gammaproteobacteria bacterium]
MKILTLVTVLLLTLSFNSYASDLAKEKRWATQVVDAILDGEAVWLNDGKSEFLGIYTEAGEDEGRAVIVMHGTGIHPDWQQVIQPLRVGLTEHGWNTLSIQMPILANDADYSDYAPLYDEVAPRINAAIKYLKDHGSKNIVLIGHSQGSAMTAYYLSSSKADVKGFVAIGMAAFADDPRMNSIKALEKIQLPVLDLYGTDDLDSILASVNSRAAAAKKAGNNNYTQIKITGNHFFDGHEATLVTTVAEWLDKLPVQ